LKEYKVTIDYKDEVITPYWMEESAASMAAFLSLIALVTAFACGIIFSAATLRTIAVIEIQIAKCIKYFIVTSLVKPDTF
jgi:hypothetical protein